MASPQVNKTAIENCCFLPPQLEEDLSGVVEVIGMVSNKGTLMAATYNMLREDKGVPFGMCYDCMKQLWHA